MFAKSSHVAAWSTFTALAAGLALAGPVQATTIRATGHFVTQTISTAGNYNITAYGAQGGNSGNDNFAGGNGAKAGGVFHLDQGETLRVVVGGQGFSGAAAGGGGGGSFVVAQEHAHYTPLAIAAGGGGAGANSAGLSGQSSPSGSNGLDGSGAAGRAGTGGDGGGGGTSGGLYGPGGGGGGGGYSDAGGTGPRAADGGGGGSFTSFFNESGNAGGGGILNGFGFGGGAGNYAGAGGGGGGGYSGGGGGGPGGGGGGGGSYLASFASMPLLKSGANTGDGFVTLNRVSVAPVPEPAFLFPFAIALLGLGWIARRKQFKF